MDKKPVLPRQFYPGAQNYSIRKTFQCRLDDGTISQADVDLISSYLAEKTSTQHITEVRRKKITSTLCGWRRFIPEYRALTMVDIFSGIDKVKNSGLKRNTVRDYITILKGFLTWMIENGICSLPPEKVRKLKTVSVYQDTTDPEDLYTPDEVLAMIKATKSVRDKAIIAVLYETACRPAELSKMIWSDVEMSDGAKRVKIRIYDLNDRETKTHKPRYTPVVAGAGYLAAWANQNPGRSPKDPVFTNRYGEPIRYIALQRVVKKAMAGAGIEKELRLHSFRKSRITALCNKGVPESIIKAIAWNNQNTNMLKTYVRHGEDDIDRAILHSEGIRQEDAEKKLDAMRPRECIECGHVNTPSAEFCEKCANPLTEAALKRIRLKERMVQGTQEYLKMGKVVSRMVEESVKNQK